MMSASEPTTEFERTARTVLEESLGRVDGRIRSRLNQARHAALSEATKRHAPVWRMFALMPAAGAVAAALLVTIVLWHRRPQGELPVAPEGVHANVEDLDLLADGEGLDLVEGWDGSFYEWAVEQNEPNGVDTAS